MEIGDFVIISSEPGVSAEYHNQIGRILHIIHKGIYVKPLPSGLGTWFDIGQLERIPAETAEQRAALSELMMGFNAS